MSLKLIPPGARRGNRAWVVRGRIAGKLYEATTGCLDKGKAERVAAEIAARLHRDGGPAPDAAHLTFAEAAKRYRAWRRPGPNDERYITALVGTLGARLAAQVGQTELADVAKALYPAASAQTRNRHVIAPASAILHYAAHEGLIPYRRIKRWREPPAGTRALDHSAAQRLIDAAEGPALGLLLWLFHQGDRIGDTLRLTWSDIDMRAGTYTITVRKTQTRITRPIAAPVRAWLANLAGERVGRIWPWSSRWGAYRALRPIARRAGVTFTPHMARHSLGTWLNAEGAGLRTIMATLGHADAKSSLRYQAADADVIRAATRRATRRLRKRRNAA